MVHIPIYVAIMCSQVSICRCLYYTQRKTYHYNPNVVYLGRAFRFAKYYLIYDAVHMGHNRRRIQTISHDLEKEQEGIPIMETRESFTRSVQNYSTSGLLQIISRKSPIDPRVQVESLPDILFSFNPNSTRVWGESQPMGLRSFDLDQPWFKLTLPRGR